MRRSIESASEVSDEPGADSTLTIVVHYGDPALTRAAVDSILRDRVRPHRLAIVDNGPGHFDDAGLGESVSVLRPGRNIGFAAAVNAAVEAFVRDDTSLIWLFNNDAVAEPGALEALLASMRRSENKALVSSLINDASTGDAWFERARFYPWRLESRHVRGPSRRRADTVDRLPPSAKSIAYLPACSLLAPRALFDAIGGLDTSFFLYGEDVDLSVKASRLGYDLVVANASVVSHRASSGSTMRYRQRAQAEAALRLTARYYPWMVPSALIGGTLYGLRRTWSSRQPWWVTQRLAGYADALETVLWPRPAGVRPVNE